MPERGHVDYITKPVNKDTLLATVQEPKYLGPARAAAAARPTAAGGDGMRRVTSAARRAT